MNLFKINIEDVEFADYGGEKIILAAPLLVYAACADQAYGIWLHEYCEDLDEHFELSEDTSLAIEVIEVPAHRGDKPTIVRNSRSHIFTVTAETLKGLS
jgi:hypothetical protein